MSPKNLLRHKDCKSHLSEFDDLVGHPGFDKQGTRFKRLIKDRNDHKDLEEGINRLILCSGKVGLYLRKFTIKWQVFTFPLLCHILTLYVVLVAVLWVGWRKEEERSQGCCYLQSWAALPSPLWPHSARVETLSKYEELFPCRSSQPFS